MFHLKAKYKLSSFTCEEKDVKFGKKFHDSVSDVISKKFEFKEFGISIHKMDFDLDVISDTNKEFPKNINGTIFDKIEFCLEFISKSVVKNYSRTEINELNNLREITKDNSVNFKDAEIYKTIVENRENETDYSFAAVRYKNAKLFEYFLKTFGYSRNFWNHFFTLEEKEICGDFLTDELDFGDALKSKNIKTIRKYKEKCSPVLYNCLFKCNSENIDFYEELFVLKLLPEDFRLNSPDSQIRYSSETLIYFLVNGYDINLTNRLGYNLLQSCHKESEMKMLLKRGINVNNQDNNGGTALHQAVLCYDKGVKQLQLLLDFGADIRLKDNRGFTPLSFLKKKIQLDYFGKEKRECVVKMLKILNLHVEKIKNIVLEELKIFLIKDLSKIVCEYI